MPRPLRLLLFLSLSASISVAAFVFLILPALQGAKRDFAEAPSVSAPATSPSVSTPSETLRFGIVSDSENDAESSDAPTLRALSNEMQKSGVAFALHLGDFANRATPDAYDAFARFTATTGFPWHMVPGNHDLLQPSSQTGRDYDPSLFTTHFGPRPEVFVVGSVLFVLLDNADNTIGFSGAALGALESELSSPRAKTASTIILGMHRPVKVPYAAAFGYFDGTVGAADVSYVRFEQILRDAPTHEKLRLYTGHIHSTFRYDLAGVPVLVTGGGGSERNVGSLGLPSFPHWYQVDVEDGVVKETLKTIE